MTDEELNAIEARVRNPKEGPDTQEALELIAEVRRLAADRAAMARLLLKATVPPRGNEWSCLGDKCGTWEEGKHSESCSLLATLRTTGVTHG